MVTRCGAQDTAAATADHPVVLPVTEDIPAGRTDQLVLATRQPPTGS